MKGVSLIELVIATAIVGVTAAMIVPAYPAYRMRVQRFNAQTCLLNMARQQEAYFTRHQRYATDLRMLGYRTAEAAVCENAGPYRMTAASMDATGCPLSRCYQLSAIPQDTAAKDDALHLMFDASHADPSQRMKKERGSPGSGRPWH